MKYKVGDRVRLVKKLPRDKPTDYTITFGKYHKRHLGKIATITYRQYCIDKFSYEYAIDIDNGLVPWDERLIEGVVYPSIHITTDGITTHAIMKEGSDVIKKSRSICSHDDEFNLFTGASLALARLV